MRDQRATDRLTGLALAGVVVAILAVGLAVGQNDWHDALVIVGALLQVTAILYATRLIWLALIASWRSPRPAGDTAPAPAPAESPRTGLIPLFSITPDDALVAGAMAIAGIVLTAVGNLV
jgi:predicted small integral membrane protein